MIFLKLGFLFAFFFLVELSSAQNFIFHLLSQSTSVSALKWTGLAGDHKWSTAGNWSGFIVTGAADVASFETASCSGINCNATVDVGVSIKGLSMDATFAGTLTQSVGQTVAVGASGWLQDGGTFVGSNAGITINGPFDLTGGSFASTSGTLLLYGNLAFTGSSSFNHNSGTVQFVQGSSALNLNPGAAIFFNVKLSGNDNSQLSSHTLTGTMVVNGTLDVLNDVSLRPMLYYGGTISAAGSVNFSNLGMNSQSTTLIKIVGVGNRTITGAAGAGIPDFQIATDGGIVTFTGTLQFLRNYTYTSGTLSVSSPVSNVALATAGSTASASSSYSGNYLPSGSINGDRKGLNWGTPSGGWNDGTSSSFPDWLEVDFGSVQSIEKVVVYSVQDSYASPSEPTDVMTFSSYGLTAFDVKYDSAGSWVTVSGGSITGNNLVKRTVSFPAVTTSKIRVYTNASSDGQYSRIAEVEAFTPLGPSATFIFSGGLMNLSIVPGTAAYGNVIFVGNQTNYSLSGTMIITGALTVGDTTGSGQMNSGTIVAKGDVTFNNLGVVGSTLIKVNGSSDQTIGGVAGAKIPQFEVASTGGTVTYSGTLSFSNSYTQTSGAVAVGSTAIQFVGNGATYSLSPGSVAFNNVSFLGSAAVYNLTGTLTANGTLILADSVSGSINSGTLVVNSNLVVSGAGYGGTTSVSFGGASNNSIARAAGAAFPTGDLTVNKASTSVLSLASNSSFNAAGQNLTITAGILDLSGFAMTVNSVLSIAASGTLKCSGGSYSSGSFVMNGGIDCGGFLFNWTGAGGNSNWTTAANWSGGIVPGPSDVAIFGSSYCGVNCNAVINASINVNGIRLLSGYAGVLTQAVGQSISLGTSGWVQAAGTFVGGNSGINIPYLSIFTLTGGSFTSTAGIFNLYQSNLTISGGTFIHNSGTVRLQGDYMSSVIFSAVGQSFYNFVFDTVRGAVDLAGGTITTEGTLTLGDQEGSNGLRINSGTILALGNVAIVNFGHKDGGTANIKVAGSGNQTIDATGATTGYISKFEIASTGGTVTVLGTLVLSYSSNFTITSGTLASATANLLFDGEYSTSASMVFTSAQFNNVEFRGGHSSFYLGGGTLSVLGTLTLNDLSTGDPGSIHNGTILAYGNVNATTGGKLGTGLIRLVGTTGSQTITGVATARFPNFEIATAGASVAFSGTLFFPVSYTYTSGSVNAGTSQLSFFTEYGGNLNIVPGAVTYNNVTFNGVSSHYSLVGGTMHVGGTLTIADTYLGGYINSGTLDAKGNVVVSGEGCNGSAALQFTGAGQQTVDASAATTANFPLGNITINNASGIKLLSNVAWNGASQATSVTSGPIDMNGKNLTLKSLGLNSNTLTKNTGILTVNGTVAGTGALFGGTVNP